MMAPTKFSVEVAALTTLAGGAQANGAEQCPDRLGYARERDCSPEP